MDLMQHMTQSDVPRLKSRWGSSPSGKSSKQKDAGKGKVGKSGSETPLNDRGMSSPPWDDSGRPNLKQHVWHMMTVPEDDDRTFDEVMQRYEVVLVPKAANWTLALARRRSSIVTIDTKTGYVGLTRL